MHGTYFSKISFIWNSNVTGLPDFYLATLRGEVLRGKPGVIARSAGSQAAENAPLPPNAYTQLSQFYLRPMLAGLSAPDSLTVSQGKDHWFQVSEKRNSIDTHTQVTEEERGQVRTWGDSGWSPSAAYLETLSAPRLSVLTIQWAQRGQFPKGYSEDQLRRAIP